MKARRMDPGSVLSGAAPAQRAGVVAAACTRGAVAGVAAAPVFGAATLSVTQRHLAEAGAVDRANHPMTDP